MSSTEGTWSNLIQSSGLCNTKRRNGALIVAFVAFGYLVVGIHDHHRCLVDRIPTIENEITFQDPAALRVRIVYGP